VNPDHDGKPRWMRRAKNGASVMPMADFQTHASVSGRPVREIRLSCAVWRAVLRADAACFVMEPHGDLVDDTLAGCDNVRLAGSWCST